MNEYALRVPDEALGPAQSPHAGLVALELAQPPELELAQPPALALVAVPLLELVPLPERVEPQAWMPAYQAHRAEPPWVALAMLVIGLTSLGVVDRKRRVGQ